jgi:hypothetical protein
VTVRRGFVTGRYPADRDAIWVASMARAYLHDTAASLYRR